jgi:hypothetical protein
MEVDMEYKLDFFSEINANGIRETTAMILDDKGDCVATGIVKRHTNDQDCRVIGQKEALKKLLEHNTFEWEDRRDLWHQFFMRSDAAIRLFSR